MSSTPEAKEYRLDHNHPLSLGRARGASIICLSGMIWITVSGKLEDIFLTAGQDYRIGDDGFIIVEGIGSGRIRLEWRQTAGSGWLATIGRLMAPSKGEPDRLET